MLAFVLAALTIAPWSGTDLPTATQAQAKYRLTVTGAPGAKVKLTTSDVAKGWIAAFCDRRVCSPRQVTETIPPSGRARVQLELIREADDASNHSGVVVHASDGASVRASI